LFVGWLVGWLAGWLACLLACLLGLLGLLGLLAFSLACLLPLLLASSLACLLACLDGWMVGLLVLCFSHSVSWSVGKVGEEEDGTGSALCLLSVFSNLLAVLKLLNQFTCGYFLNAMTINIILFFEMSVLALKPTHPPIERIHRLFPGVKLSGSEADHSPASSANVQKERSRSSAVIA
jgi:hypothetical protein